jgi:tight adherence protein C
MSALPVLYASLLVTSFSALGLASYALASAPALPPHRLGIRGLKRVRAIQQSPFFAGIEPALRGAGSPLRQLLSRSSQAALDRRLTLAGDYLGLWPEELAAACLLAAGLALALGAAYAFLAEQSLAYVPAAALLAGLIPYSKLSALAEARRTRVDHGLPPVIDLLVLSLSAGLDLPGALRQVVEKSSTPTDPLIEEFGFVLQELQVGKTRHAALSQLAERLPSGPLRQFVAAVIQAEQHGNPLARVLTIHAEVSRRERSTRAEEAAAKAGVKMMVPLTMVFGAVLLLIAGPMFLTASASL